MIIRKAFGGPVGALGILFVCVAGLVLGAASARADEPGAGGNGAAGSKASAGGELDSSGGIPSGRLTANPDHAYHGNLCTLAAFWKAEAEKAGAASEAKAEKVVRCFEQLEIGPVRESLLGAADKYLSAAKAYFAYHTDAAPPDVCRPSAATASEAKPADGKEGSGGGQAASAAPGVAEAAKAVRAAEATLLAAIQAVEDRKGRSPADFEAHTRNVAWVKACTDFRARAVKAGALLLADKQKNEDAAEEEGRRARASDILRKTTSVPGAAAEGGFLETGGAPDHVVYTLFSALGADQKTTGTQVLMTLNLGQLWPGGGALEDRPAWQRNLFLRAGLPLTATQEAPASGASTGASVSRMSFVVGTSLFDETDPRVESNQQCYLSALHYAPLELTAPSDTSVTLRQKERKEYFDICNRVAANRQRLVLRAGLGLVVEKDDAATTRPEYLSGAAVWAPASWVYFNALYQRRFVPSLRHSFGGGLSAAVNAPSGPGGSGVDAWTRLGVDVLVLGLHDDAARSTDIEVRLQATARFKLPTSGIITLGIGPKLLGTEIKSPGVLASAGLTYDADALLSPLLDPASAGAK